MSSISHPIILSSSERIAWFDTSITIIVVPIAIAIICLTDRVDAIQNTPSKEQASSKRKRLTTFCNTCVCSICDTPYVHILP